MFSDNILSDKFSGIYSGKHFGTLSGIPFGILYNILFSISFGISYGILSDILSGIPSGILSDISSGILSGKYFDILFGIFSGILSDILSGILSGISSDILSGRWGPAVLIELGGSPIEVQRYSLRIEVQWCSLSSEGPRLRSSGVQYAQFLVIKVQQCPLRAEVSEELGEELARRK